MDKWLEVDLKKLKSNVLELQKFIRVPIMAVLKQNGYGMGAVPMGKFLEHFGIRHFAVTSLEEGCELRRGGVKSPILVYAPVIEDAGDLDKLIQYRLIPTVYSIEIAEVLNEYAQTRGKVIEVYVKIDTGLGRMGLRPEEILKEATYLKGFKGLKYGAVFTHYSNAFEKRMDYTKKQFELFQDTVAQLAEKGLSFPVKFSANTQAALKFPETHMDMVNIGSAFLGSSPNPKIQLKKIYTCKARVLQIKELPAGSFIGYSNAYRLRKDTRVAIIPIGYSDGFLVKKRVDSFRMADFLRELYNFLKEFIGPADTVFYKEQGLKVVGKTGMQLTVVDSGKLPITAGDIVNIDLNPMMAKDSLARKYVGYKVELIPRLHKQTKNNYWSKVG